MYTSITKTHSITVRHSNIIIIIINNVAYQLGPFPCSTLITFITWTMLTPGLCRVYTIHERLLVHSSLKVNSLRVNYTVLYHSNRQCLHVLSITAQVHNIVTSKCMILISIRLLYCTVVAKGCNQFSVSSWLLFHERKTKQIQKQQKH